VKLRTRSLPAAVLTVAATVGLAGCSVFSPPTVLKPYEPSDGTGGELEGVQIRNVLVVSGGVDEPGVLAAVLVNSGEEDASVSVSVDVDAGSATAQSYFVAAGSSLHIGDPVAVAEDTATTDDDSGSQQEVGWLQVPQVPVTPGETVPVTFRISGAASQFQAPVMLPCFEYATITPTPSAEETTPVTETDPVTCGPEVGAESGEEH